MAENEMILRDHLAMDRTKLANYRTMLAFVRTSLYLVVSGLAVMNVEVLEGIRFLGWILIGSSLITFISGIWNYFHFRSKMKTLYMQD